MTDPALLSAPPMRTIETPRLRLRTVRVSDSVKLLPIITDPTTMKYTSGVVADDLEKAEKWLGVRALGDGVFNFVITLRKDGGGGGHDDGVNGAEGEEEEEQIVGIMGSYHWPEIGYLMHPAHAGKGYATEALRAFIPAFFAHMPTPSHQNLGFDYIQAETDQENVASHRVLRKSGFEFVEKLENAFESPVLGVRDTLIFRVARPGVRLEDIGVWGGRLIDSRVHVAAWKGLREGEEEGEEGFVPPVQ